MFIIAIIIALVLYSIASDMHWQNSTSEEQSSFLSGFNSGIIIAIIMFLFYFAVKL